MYEDPLLLVTMPVSITTKKLKKFFPPTNMIWKIKGVDQSKTLIVLQTSVLQYNFKFIKTSDCVKNK